MLPLANKNARIVVVSSNFSLRAMFQISGNPNKHSDLNEVELIGRQLFSTNGTVLTPTELDSIAEKFVTEWRTTRNPTGSSNERLWPDYEMTPMPGYDMAKLLINNLVRYYSQQSELKNKNILINGVCPGFCGTGKG